MERRHINTYITLQKQNQKPKVYCNRSSTKSIDWAREWKLVFSIGKCASLTFSRRRSPQPTLKLNLMGSLIKEVKQYEQYKFLGLIFDSKLSWEQHINEVNTCIQRRGNILKALTLKKIFLSTTLD
jgi:hypothetical protein